MATERTRPWIRGALTWAAMTWLSLATAAGQDGAARSTATPTPETATAANRAFDREASAGLFVGVREFESADFAEVPYAVDDAVDLAYLFSFDLNLIPPENVVLALAGVPQKAESVERLAELTNAGARRELAEENDLLRLFKDFGTNPDPAASDGILILAVASHGTEEYLLAADSEPGDLLAQTSLNVADMMRRVDSSVWGRRLVLVDACREALETGRAIGTTAPPMSETFRDALALARGTVVLSATTAGGYAFDDASRQNGVFSAAILDALDLAEDGRGAEPDDSGFVTADRLQAFVNQRVLDWITVNRPGFADGSLGISYRADPPTLGGMPLVEHPERGVRQRADALAVLNRQVGAGRISPILQADIAEVMDAVAVIEALDASGPDLDPLIARTALFESLEEIGTDADLSLYAGDFSLWWIERGSAVLGGYDATRTDPFAPDRAGLSGPPPVAELPPVSESARDEVYAFLNAQVAAGRIPAALFADMDKWVLDNPEADVGPLAARARLLARLVESGLEQGADVYTSDFALWWEVERQALSFSESEVASVQMTADPEFGAPLGVTATRLDTPTSIVGTLTPEDRTAVVDRYAFDGRAGQVVRIELESDSFDGYLVLEGGGEILAEDDDTGGGLNPVIETTLPSTGEYLIHVTSYERNSTGDYSLSVEVLETDVRVVRGTLSPDDEMRDGVVDYFAFWGTEGMTVRMSMEAAFDTYLILARGEEVLARVDDSNFFGRNAFLEATLPADDVYVVRATSYGNESSGDESPEFGDYALRTDSFGLWPVAGFLDSEDGEAEGELREGDNQFNDGSYVDYWLMTGNAGEEVTIAMAADFETYLSVEATNETRIASAQGTTAEITLTLPRNGSFLVSANALDAGVEGAYRLSIR